MMREMSLIQNPLSPKRLSATLLNTVTLRVAEQARERIRDGMREKALSQRDVAELLKWSQSRVAKLLNARVEMGVDDLEALCFAVGITLTEAVRDRGLEFCAEMTPTELRVLERFRQLQPNVRDAVMTLLDVRAHTPLSERRAMPARKKIK